jgi:hypothetical protein
MTPLLHSDLPTGCLRTPILTRTVPGRPKLVVCPAPVSRRLPSSRRRTKKRPTPKASRPFVDADARRLVERPLEPVASFRVDGTR